jgi:hypothetical protein
MYNNIIFYSPFHNGDIHVSRTFVREIINNVKAENYYYAHECHERILSDIPNLKYKKLDFTTNTQIQYEIKDNNLYINTWVGQCNFRYFDGCTFTALYRIFTDMFKSLKIDIKEKEYYLPYIDYDKFDIFNLDSTNIINSNKRKIFICNCECLAYQADNFNFEPIIDYFSNKYNDYLFFISNNSAIKKENVINTKDVINNNTNDLNENSYITTKCDVIIGRSSGSYTFSLVKENMLDSNKKFIVFCHNDNTGIWYPEQKCKTIWSANYNIDDIIKIIDCNV